MTESWPPRFTVDNGRVLRLFTGDRFYSSSDAALREALLNAIDACGRRRDTLPSLAPVISLTFDEDAKTITIADNGDGMSQEDITQFFTKIGASAAQLAEEVAGGGI